MYRLVYDYYSFMTFAFTYLSVIYFSHHRYIVISFIFVNNIYMYLRPTLHIFQYILHR